MNVRLFQYFEKLSLESERAADAQIGARAHELLAAHGEVSHQDEDRLPGKVCGPAIPNRNADPAVLREGDPRNG